MTGTVRLMRQLTSQDVPVKQGGALSLPLAREPGKGSYFYMNTKLRNAMQNRWPQSLQTAAASCAYLSSLPFPLLQRGMRRVRQDWPELTSQPFAMLSGS